MPRIVPTVVQSSTVADKVRDILVTFGQDAEQITPGTKLLEDLGLDSLDIVELVMELEEAYDIDIPDDDVMDTDHTVQQIVDYVEKRLKENATA